MLPVDYGPAADPHGGPGEPVVESVWVEPYPDEMIGVEDGLAGPDAHYEQREGVELAFVAALQLLPANQRAVLILREVLGFSAKEVADALDTSVASVNSALQRARKAVEERVPEQSQQDTLRALGDDELSEIVDRYVDAWEHNDVETVIVDARRGRDLRDAAARHLVRRHGRDRHLPRGLADVRRLALAPVRTTANGQPALAFYAWDEDERAYLPFALNVLTFRGAQISDVGRSSRAPPTSPPPVLRALGDEPMDPNRLYASFERFGLPGRWRRHDETTGAVHAG